MLCILAMFIPALFMVGAAKAMFLPLSLAVGFSMVASYLLSSTLVPILSVWVLRGHEQAGGSGRQAGEGAFARFQRAYARLGARRRCAGAGWWSAVYLVAAGAIIVFLGRGLGTEIFPRVEAGQLQVRLRAPAGTQIDGTEAVALRALDLIKQEAGPQNVEITLGFLGVHGANYPINFIYLWNGGPEEGVVQVQLKQGAPDPHRGAEGAAAPEVRRADAGGQLLLRAERHREPGDEPGFAHADRGGGQRPEPGGQPRLRPDHQRPARSDLPALRDLQFGQSLDYPTVDVTVDRQKAGVMGVKMADVSRSLVTATWSSRFVVPNYWADPNSGVSYQIQVQVPQARMDSLEQARNVPVMNRDGQGLLLRNVAKVTEGTAVGQYQRYNMQRLVTVTANIAGADLGSVARQVMAAVKELGPAACRGERRRARPDRAAATDAGRLARRAAAGRGGDLPAAGGQFPVAETVVPGSGSPRRRSSPGVVVMLWLTGTTLNIQSFMGAIMAIGVAVANAILLVTFAERARVGQASRLPSETWRGDRRDACATIGCGGRRRRRRAAACGPSS